MFTAQEIDMTIIKGIEHWHDMNSKRSKTCPLVTDDIRKIREFGSHRSDLLEIVQELADTNSEMWHEEDKVRSLDDAVVLEAIRNINPLNQHRNDLMEEADECVQSMTVIKKGV